MNWPSGPRPPPAQWLRTRSTWWPPPTTSTSPSSCRSFPTSQRYASASRSSLEICRIHNYTSSCKMSSKERTEHFEIAKIEELLIKKEYCKFTQTTYYSWLTNFHHSFYYSTVQVKRCGIDFRWNMFGMTEKVMNIWIVDFEKYLYYKQNEQDADNLATGLSSCTKLTKLSIREEIRNFNHHHTHLMPLSSSSLPQHGVTEVGSLSAIAKMATKFFVWCVVAIFARNASFLPLIAIYPLNSVHYTIFIMW